MEFFADNIEVRGSQTFAIKDIFRKKTGVFVIMPFSIENPFVTLTSKNNRQAGVICTSTHLTITLDSEGDNEIGLFDISIKSKEN